MGNNLRDKVLELYTGLGIYHWLYIKLRTKLLPLGLYQEILPSEGLLIDIGCSYGIVANYLALRFPNSQVIGIDLDHKRIDVALKTVGKRGNIAFLLKDARDWALPSCTGVIMIDFLHHIPRREQELILRRVFHGLEREGVLLISEVDSTAKPFYRYWASYLSDRVLYPFSRSNFRKPREWESILSSIGFSVKTIEIRNTIFAPALYVCHK